MSFQVRHIPIYIHYYYSRYMFAKFVKFFQINNLPIFAMRGGIGDYYIFDIEDRIIPFDMCLKGVTWASDEMELFVSLCKEKYGYDINDGGVFLDIGANIGTTSIWMDKKAKGALEIHAFEAVPSTYRLLKANGALNGDHIIPHNVALSNAEQELSMFIFPDNNGRNQVVSRENADRFTNEIIKVKAYNLDDYLEREGINYDDIKYIWMDVEGHEPNIIEGMQKLLSHHRIPIFMEFSPDSICSEQVKVLQGILENIYEKAIAVSTKDGKRQEINIRDIFSYYNEIDEQKNLFLY